MFHSTPTMAGLIFFLSIASILITPSESTCYHHLGANESFFQQPELNSSLADSIVVNDGDSLRLNCTAANGSDPVPSMHWVRLDSPMSSGSSYDSSGSLYIPSFTSSHHGLYVCVAVNNVGMAVSNIVTLSVNGSTKIFNLNNNVKVDEVQLINDNETVLASCCVEESLAKPENNHWLRLNSNAAVSFPDNQTTSSITMPNLIMSMFNSSVNEDIYFCLTGDEHSVTVYATKLKAKPPTCSYSVVNSNVTYTSVPTDSSQPVAISGSSNVLTIARVSSADIGDYVRLRCCFEDDYSIRFIRFDMEFVEIADHAGNESKYQEFPLYDVEFEQDRYISITEEADFGQYYCVLRDSADEIFAFSNRLSLSSTSGFTDWSDNFDSKTPLADFSISAEVGNDILLFCSSGRDSYFHWFKNGQYMTNTARVYGVDTDALVIEDFMSSDVAIYSCLSDLDQFCHYYVTETASKCVTDEIKSPAVAFQFTKPTLTSTPTSGTMNVSLGSSFTMMCTASGSPTPNIYWKRLDTGETAATGQNFIANFSASDSGVYVCVAVNSVGMDVSDIIILTNGSSKDVFDLNTVKVDEIKEVDVGENVMGVCRIDRYKQVGYKWLRLDATPISSDESKIITVLNFNQTEEDVYICISGNEDGISLHSLKLKLRKECTNYSLSFDMEQSNEISLAQQLQLVNYTLTADVAIDTQITTFTYNITRNITVNVTINVNSTSNITNMNATGINATAINGTAINGTAINGSMNATPNYITIIRTIVETVEVSIINITLNFTCYSTPSIDGIKWIRTDGQNISDSAIGANTSNLTIVNAEETDLGFYACVVVSGNDFIVSEVINVTRETKVQRTGFNHTFIELENANVTSVAITCCSNGREALFKWYKNGFEVTQDVEGRINGSSSKTLIISNINVEDYGLYTCIAGVSNEEISFHYTYLEERQVYIASSSVVPTPSMLKTSSVIFPTTSSTTSSSMTVVPTDPPTDHIPEVDVDLSRNTFPLRDASLIGVLSLLGLLGAILVIIGIFFICCKRGIFKNSPTYRVLNTKPPRLWDIIWGHDEQKLQDAIDEVVSQYTQSSVTSKSEENDALGRLYADWRIRGLYFNDKYRLELSDSIGSNPSMTLSTGGGRNGSENFHSASSVEESSIIDYSSSDFKTDDSGSRFSSATYSSSNSSESSGGSSSSTYSDTFGSSQDSFGSSEDSSF